MSLFRFIPARAWLLVVSSALLQIFIFPTGGPVSMARESLAWVALVPFFVALLLPDANGKALRVRDAFALGYLCGILWYLGNCYWIYQTMHLYGGMAKPVSFGILVLFSLYLGLYHALFAAILLLLRRSRLGVSGALLLTPVAWVAVELARARITGFPWDLLGYTQIDNLLITRVAPVAGVMAISFFVAAINAELTAYFFLKGPRRIIVPASALAFAAVITLFGSVDAHVEEKANANTPYAVMMQENIAVGATSFETTPLSVEDELTTFSRMTLAPTSVGPERSGLLSGKVATHPTVILWPEAPAHFRSDDPEFRTALGSLAREEQAPAIVGSLGVDFTGAAPRGYYLYDSASLFDAAGNYVKRYDKIHRVPWGEYVPFEGFFGYFVHKLTEGAGDMDAGADRTVFATGGHTYGVFICYESIFGDEVREFAKNGAEVLVNISDDGWYGDTGAPWQHLNMARMRAIENHRWVLRDTNTGITTAIDPQGRVQLEAPRHTRGAYVFPFSFEEGTTLYTRYGDWFAWLCSILSVLALVFAISKYGAPFKPASKR